MDAQKWRQITSSFNFDTFLNNSNGPVVKSSSHSREASSAAPCHGHNSQSRCKDNVEDKNGNASLLAEMSEKIRTMDEFLVEQSRVIEHQKNLIISLQQKLLTLGVKDDHEEVSQIESTIKDVRTASKSSSDAIVRNTNNNKKSSTDSIIAEISKRIETLECRLTTLLSSLPKKIQSHCQKYISSCRFHYDDSETYLIAIPCLSSPSPSSSPMAMIPSAAEDKWSKSPRIKPKDNHSSQIRLGYHHQNQKQHPPISTKFHNDDSLQRLEVVVNELKVNFVQLLLDKCPPPTNIIRKGAANSCCNSKTEINQNAILGKISRVLQNVS